MDKHSKLQRYTHKDYSGLVEFPVEIVGRDGVIRRYSFEDAVRLYQRRVTFAPIRYRDRELVEAEIVHCRHRIDQLRRSFFYRFGWGTPAGDPEPQELFGELAGEIAAFVRRVLRTDDRPDIRLEPIEPGADGVGTWFLVPAGAPHGMLLYVHRFQAEDRDAARERFFSTLKSMERSEDDERLLAFHHAADCGFILTAQEGQFEALISLTDDDGIIRDVMPTNWELALDQVRLGRYAGALEAAERVIASNALDRRAYVLGAALAWELDRPVDLLTFAQVGALYFPEDPDLRFWLGVALLRSGAWGQARAPLESLLRSKPRSSLARAALLPIYLRRLRLVSALRLVISPPPARPDEPMVARALRAIDRSARLAAVVLLLVTFSQIVGTVLLFALGWPGALVILLGAVLAALVVIGFGLELRRQLRFGGLGDLSWWVRRLTSPVHLGPPVA